MNCFKKILTVVLVVCMMFSTLSLVACNKDKNKDNGSNNNNNDKNDNNNTATTYTVTFIDTDGDPVVGVKAMATTGTKFSPAVTSDKDGVAKFDCSEFGEGTVYLFIVKVPDEYVKPETDADTSYHGTFSKSSTTLELVIEKKPDTTVAYTVTVVDQYGNPVEGALVTMCDNVCYPEIATDANGKATNNLEPGLELHIKVKAPAGYNTDNHTPDADGYIAVIGEGDTEIVINKN